MAGRAMSRGGVRIEWRGSRGWSPRESWARMADNTSTGDGVEDKVFDVIVVGGGVAGAASALRAGQYHLDTLWLRGDRETAKRSRAEYVYNIDNMIGLHPDLVRDKVLGLLDGDEFEAAREKIGAAHLAVSTKDIVRNTVQRLAADYPDLVEMREVKAVAASQQDELFTVQLEDGGSAQARNVVLATGVMDIQPNVKVTTKKGAVRDGIQWIFPHANQETLLYCIRCEWHLTRDLSTAVIGSSETAAQIALMLRERYTSPVTLLTNGDEPSMSEETAAVLAASAIPVLTPRLVEVIDGGEKPRGSSLAGFRLEDGTQVDARFAMVSLGLFRVYNELARELGAELEGGEATPDRQHVLVEDHSSETSVRGLFTVGDMAKRRDGGPLMKQVYTAQEYSVRAVDTIDRRKRSAGRKALLAAAGEKG